MNGKPVVPEHSLNAFLALLQQPSSRGAHGRAAAHDLALERQRSCLCYNLLVLAMAPPSLFASSAEVGALHASSIKVCVIEGA